MTGDLSQYLFEILAVLASVAPLAGLAIWAHAANKNHAARIVLIIVLALIGGVEVLAGALLLLVNASVAVPGMSLLSLSIALVVIGVITLALLFAPVRQLVSRVTPTSAASAVDMAGLIVITHVIGVCLALLVGVDVLSLVAATPQEELSLGVPSLIIQFIQYPILAYIAVGVLITRGFRSSSDRLGLRWPSLKWIGVALGIVVVAFITDAIINAIVMQLQPEALQKMSELMDEMFGNLLNPVGALTVGLTAGIGEELLFRGAIQPRFGIFLTSVMFTVIHLQYGFTLVLLQIFVLSILLGLLRRRAGTVAAMITHAVYNTAGVLLAAYAAGAGP